MSVARDIEEQRPACVRKAAHVADDAERLAGEAGEQQIVLGHVEFLDLRYIADWRMAEIRRIGSAAIFVDVRGKHALRRDAGLAREVLHRLAKATDPAEKIDILDSLRALAIEAVLHRDFFRRAGAEFQHNPKSEPREDEFPGNRCNEP